MKIQKRVSVPSQGILFPNSILSSYRVWSSFVSVPSRDILFPNKYFKNVKTLEELRFPSPLGVSYFQIMISLLLMILGTLVSVPSRGILFPNKNLINSYNGILVFPSPLGVSYFQIMGNLILLEYIQYANFRPLSGYLFSKLEDCILHIKKNEFYFRPLSGYLISKYKKEFQTRYIENYFRPLSGYLISQ